MPPSSEGQDKQAAEKKPRPKDEKDGANTGGSGGSTPQTVKKTVGYDEKDLTDPKFLRRVWGKAREQERKANERAATANVKLEAAGAAAEAQDLVVATLREELSRCRTTNAAPLDATKEEAQAADQLGGADLYARCEELRVLIERVRTLEEVLERSRADLVECRAQLAASQEQAQAADTRTNELWRSSILAKAQQGGGERELRQKLKEVEAERDKLGETDLGRRCKELGAQLDAANERFQREVAAEKEKAQVAETQRADLARISANEWGETEQGLRELLRVAGQRLKEALAEGARAAEVGQEELHREVRERKEALEEARGKLVAMEGRAEAAEERKEELARCKSQPQTPNPQP
jgi:hypothetical protein